MSFFDDNSAMSPFFDETVSVKTVRAGVVSRFSVSACVFPLADDNPFSETDAKSSRLRYSVTIPFEGWTVRDSPREGDVIRRDLGVDYVVEKVARGVAGWDMEVREC